MKIEVNDGTPIEVRLVFDGPITDVAPVGAIVAPWGGGGSSLYTVRSKDAVLQLDESARDLVALSNLLPPSRVDGRRYPWDRGWGSGRSSRPLILAIAKFLEERIDPQELRAVVSELINASPERIIEAEIKFLKYQPKYALVDRRLLRRLFTGVAWNQFAEATVQKSLTLAAEHEAVVSTPSGLGSNPIEVILPPLESIYRTLAPEYMFKDLREANYEENYKNFWNYRTLDVCGSAVRTYEALFSEGGYRRTDPHNPEIADVERITSNQSKALLDEAINECRRLNEQLVKYLRIRKALQEGFEIARPTKDNNIELKAALGAAGQFSPDQYIAWLSQRYWVYIADFRNGDGPTESAMSALSKRTARDLAIAFAPRFSFKGKYFLVSERTPPLFYAGLGLVTWSRPTFRDERPQSLLEGSGTRPQHRLERQLGRLEGQFTNDLDAQIASVLDASSALYIVRNSEASRQLRKIRRDYVFDDVVAELDRLSAAREQLLQAYGDGVQWAPEPARVVEHGLVAPMLKGDVVLRVVPILRMRFSATERGGKPSLEAGQKYAVALTGSSDVALSEKMRKALDRSEAADRSQFMAALKRHIAENRRYILTVTRTSVGRLSTVTEGEIRDDESEWIALSQLNLPLQTMNRIAPVLEAGGVAARIGESVVVHLGTGTLRAKTTHNISILGKVAN